MGGKSGVEEALERKVLITQVTAFPNPKIPSLLLITNKGSYSLFL
jgi:hypothetical protein